MTSEDRRDFDRLDQAVDMAARAATVLVAGGHALKTIRDRQLFRAVAATWEAYLEKRGLTRRRADQLVAAAAVLDAVSDKIGTTVPSLSERALRPLVGMDADQAAEVVVEASLTDDGITPATIKRAAAKRQKAKAAKAPRPRRFKVPGATVVVEFNRKTDRSAINALAAAMRQAESELETADAA